MKLSAAQVGVTDRNEVVVGLPTVDSTVVRHDALPAILERNADGPMAHRAADDWRASVGRAADADFSRQPSPPVLKAAATACLSGTAEFHVMPRTIHAAESVAAGPTSHAAQLRALGQNAAELQRLFTTLLDSMRVSLGEARACVVRSQSLDAPLSAIEKVTQDALPIVERILKVSRRRDDSARSDQSGGENQLHSAGQRVAELAHHLNNLFAAARAAHHAIKRGRPPAAILDLLNDVVTGAESKLKDMSPLGEPGADVAWRDLDLGNLAHRAGGLLRLGRADGAVALEVQMGDSLPVRGDDAQLLEAILNLASNALDAVAESGKPGRVVISTTRQDGASCVIIQDNGPGMSPEVQARMFEPHFSTKRERGNGLGLPLCQSIVQAHGGRLECHSVLGQGTSFRIVFAPAVEVARSLPILAT